MLPHPLLRTLMPALLILVSNTTIAQPGPQWLGTWKAPSTDENLTISSDVIEYFGTRTLEPESPPEEFRFAYKWTDDSSEKAGDSVFESFGYMSKSTTRVALSKRYEEALDQFKRDPMDFSVSDATESRRHLGTLPDGRFKVIWAYGGGDCDFFEYVINGDSILAIQECKYGTSIRLFNRIR